MEFLALKQNLIGNFFPVLVLAGDDEWVKARSVEYIRESLDIDYAEMNVITLESPNADDIFLASGTACFFSKHKLVIVKDFVFPQREKLIEFKQRVKNFASSTEDYCCLVFLISGEDAKKLDVEGATLVNCNRLSANSLQKWAIAYAKKQEKSISPTAANRLAEYCLCDMARLNTEIEKLCLYPTQEITVEMVETMVYRDKEFLVFDLGKAIADGNTQKALEMFQTLLSQGEEVRSLFGVLYSYFRRLYYIKTSKDDTEQIAQYLNVKTGAVSFARDAAAKYKATELRTALVYFRQCDEKLKLFQNEIDVFNLLLFNLLSIKGQK